MWIWILRRGSVLLYGILNARLILYQQFAAPSSITFCYRTSKYSKAKQSELLAYHFCPVSLSVCLVVRPSHLRCCIVLKRLHCMVIRHSVPLSVCFAAPELIVNMGSSQRSTKYRWWPFGPLQIWDLKKSKMAAAGILTI